MKNLQYDEETFRITFPTAPEFEEDIDRELE